MWRVNSVEFNANIFLKDLPNQSPVAIFDGWLERIESYYLAGAEKMDATQNGFASMILQLCALDSLGTLLMNNADPEDKIREFCKKVITESPGHGLSGAEINKASEHLYFQYRCGLVHNGFTVQVGRFAKNNEPDHVFLLSYETFSAITLNTVATHKAFIVNPHKFREGLGNTIRNLRTSTAPDLKKAVAEKILDSLKVEIEISKKM